jgi:hypothetical protein
VRLLMVAVVLLLSQFVSAQQSPVDVACRFETTIGKTGAPGSSRRDWYLWRSANEVEVRQVGASQSELWTQENKGLLFYSMIFHAARRTIDFTPGDLAALRKQFAWTKLTSVIDTSQLGSQLALTGEKRRVLGFDALRYRGRTEDGVVDLWWISKLGLPASLVVRNGHRMIRTELKAVRPNGGSAFGRVDVSNYEHIDFSDLGDKESDDFVRKIEGQLPRHR